MFPPCCLITDFTVTGGAEIQERSLVCDDSNFFSRSNFSPFQDTLSAHEEACTSVRLAIRVYLYNFSTIFYLNILIFYWSAALGLDLKQFPLFFDFFLTS